MTDRRNIDPDATSIRWAAENAQMLRAHDAKKRGRAVQAAVETMVAILSHMQYDAACGRYSVNTEVLQSKGLPSPQKAIEAWDEAMDALHKETP